MRMWKNQGVTHAVHQRVPCEYPYDGYHAHTTTNCGKAHPNLPWRNTSRFSLGKINCMACIASKSENEP